MSQSISSSISDTRAQLMWVGLVNSVLVHLRAILTRYAHFLLRKLNAGQSSCRNEKKQKMEMRSLGMVLTILLLLTALASVSHGRQHGHGGKKGHHRHDDGGSGDTGSGGHDQWTNATHSIEDGNKTVETANNPEVLDIPDVTANNPEVLDVPDVPDMPDTPNVPGEDDISEVNELLNTTESWFSELLKNISQYIPVNVEYAQNVGNFCDPLAYNGPYYSIPSLIISAVLFILGVLFCFVGYRLIKINLFVMGFICAGFIVYSFFLAILSSNDQPWVLYVALAAGLLAGVVAGIVTVCIYHIGLFLIGAGVGFLFAWLLLSVIDVEYFQDNIYIPILIAIVAGVVSGLITLAYPKYLVILGTSALGAFQIAWALDYFLELGQAVYYLALFAVDRGDLSLCWYSWVVVVLCLLFFVAGMTVQLLVTGRKHNHKDDFQRGICCGLCKCCKSDSRGDYVPLQEMKK